MVLSAAASSLQYALLPAVASGCGLPRHFAVVAGLFGALVPLRVFTELDSWEACYLAAGWVVGVRILLQSWQHPQREDVGIMRSVVGTAVSAITADDGGVRTGDAGADVDHPAAARFSLPALANPDGDRGGDCRSAMDCLSVRYGLAAWFWCVTIYRLSSAFPISPAHPLFNSTIFGW